MTEEKPVTASELMKCLEGFKTSLSDELKKSMKETVHAEINIAVASINEKQEEIIEDLSSTKQLVSEIQMDHSNTKATVNELREQIEQIKNKVKDNPTTASAVIFPPPSRQPYSPLSSSDPFAQSDPDFSAALKVIQSAKQILGFSPITPADIFYLKERNSVDDDNEAMKMAIKEFLVCEMKIPTSITDNIALAKVFPPAKQPSEWSTLYAEFEDPSVSNLVNQYATNLQPGKSLSIYVPHSLWPRFQIINSIAHSYRNGPIKHKTKIKYGSNDFVLLVKPKDQTSPWTYPPLDLPPLKLSAFDGNPSSSPPPGRSRLPSKRHRSPSPESDGNRSNKSRIDTVNIETVPDTLSKSPESTSQAQPLKDPGAFHPSACASPRASSNKNFTFGSSQIPRMNTLNC